MAFLDFWQLGLFDCGFGKRALEGKAPGQNGKGLIDLMLYKRSFRDELISVRLDSVAWPTTVKDNMLGLRFPQDVPREVDC